MAKRRNKKMTEPVEARSNAKTLSRAAIYRILALVALTVVVLVIYRFFMATPYFPVVLPIYMVIGAASLLGYVIYNRGFSRRGVTVEMLPEDWSDEKKEAFLADSERRMKRSRWLLMVVFAFFFTFAIDLLELYVIPTLSGILGFSV